MVSKFCQALQIFCLPDLFLCVIIIIQALSYLCLPEFVKPDICIPDFVRLCKIFVYQTCVLCVIISIQALSDLCLPDFVMLDTQKKDRSQLSENGIINYTAFAA